MTYRQELAWLHWREAEYNAPSRTDYYLASLTAEVRRGHAKTPTDVKDSDFILKFRVRGDAPDLDLQHFKDVAVGAFGGGAARKTRTRAEAIALGWRPADMTDEERRLAGVDDRE